MTAKLMDRLQRWAKALFITESIPVSKAEVCELALYAEKGKPYISSVIKVEIEQWLGIIEKGNFAFCEPLCACLMKAGLEGIQTPLPGAMCDKCGDVLLTICFNDTLIAYYCENRYCSMGGILTRKSRTLVNAPTDHATRSPEEKGA